jgi:hypothetical protein
LAWGTGIERIMSALIAPFICLRLMDKSDHGAAAAGSWRGAFACGKLAGVLDASPLSFYTSAVPEMDVTFNPRFGSTGPRG